MKITKASIEEKLAGKGYEPVQIDGIPEGFVYFLHQGIKVSTLLHVGHYMAFIPNAEWSDNENVVVKNVVSSSENEEEIEAEKGEAREALLQKYNEVVKRNGK